MARSGLGRRVLRVWAWSGLVALVALVVWCAVAYRATAEARRAMTSDARVDVQQLNGVIRFTSQAHSGTVPMGLLFFPGSLVDPIAYAPYARAVAAAGYPVIIVPLKRRGVLTGSDPAADLELAMGSMHEDERAAQWILAGHSRGAVIAARLALQALALGSKAIGGVLLIGSTHPRDSVMASLKVPLTKIVGTNDGMAPYVTAEANKRFLPPQAKWVTIQGGNHSQFGWYGFQPGDHFASVDREAQHQQLINATLEMLRAAEETQRNTGWMAR